MIITYPFDTASDYVVNNTEIAEGKSRPIIENTSGLNFPLDFSSGSGYTYDSSKFEFVGGVLRQKDQRPLNSTFGATYTSNQNGNWGNGVLTGTLGGSASVSGGKLNVPAGSAHCVDYIAASNAPLTQTGCIRFKFTPNYSGIPAAYVALFSYGETTTPYKNRLCLLHVSGSGYLVLQIAPSGGVPYFINANVGIWTPTAGIEYEFEFNFDFTAGATRLYINGIQLGSTITDTGTRNTDGVSYFRVGNDIVGNVYGANGKFDDLLIFSAPQHTGSSYTPGYSVSENIYTTGNVISPELEHTGPGTIISVDEITSTETGAPKYSIQIGRSGNYLWWNGSSWTISNGTYAQANDITTFNTHCSSLPVLGEIYGQLKIHFTDSSTVSTISAFAFELTAQRYAQFGTTQTSEFTAREITSILETATKPTNTNIKYIILVDGVKKWHNGTAWVTSDGSNSQANTITELNNNFATLLNANATIKILIVHTTTVNDARSELSELSLTFNFAGLNIDPEKCTIYGYYKDINGQPISGAIVTARLKLMNAKQYVNALGNIIGRTYSVVTGTSIDHPDWDDGYFEIELIKSKEFEDIDGVYLLTISDALGTSEVEKNSQNDGIEFEVPDQESANITDIITTA